MYSSGLESLEIVERQRHLLVDFRSHAEASTLRGDHNDANRLSKELILLRMELNLL